MKEFLFIYKDSCGRKNQATRFADCEQKATEKFKTLYPNSYILNVI